MKDISPCAATLQAALLFSATLLTLAALPSSSFAQQAAPAGTIAYIRGGKTPGDEIRLIRPDGTGDRQIWHLPNAASTGVGGLAWRPDNREIAFSSDHDAADSVYDSNIYALHPDGSGLRQLTDPPGSRSVATYPKGKVVVTVTNSVTDRSLFLVYVAGAPAPQTITLPAGGRKTLTFNSVADFGARPHPVVAMNGVNRWLIPGGIVHAGQTLNAGTLNITPHSLRNFGFSGPAWTGDGKKVVFILGDAAGLMWSPPQPIPGNVAASSLIGGTEMTRATTYDVGPTATTVNQVLYGGGVGNQAIRRTAIGSGSPGTPLVEYSETEIPGTVQWLPDASGFLYAKSDFITANIYRYDFASKQTTQLTQLTGEFAMNFSISPDGRWVVLERRAGDGPTDLWLMRIDGSDLHLLVKNGKAPAWSR